MIVSKDSKVNFLLGLCCKTFCWILKYPNYLVSKILTVLLGSNAMTLWIIDCSQQCFFVSYFTFMVNVSIVSSPKNLMMINPDISFKMQLQLSRISLSLVWLFPCLQEAQDVTIWKPPILFLWCLILPLIQ